MSFKYRLFYDITLKQYAFGNSHVLKDSPVGSTKNGAFQSPSSKEWEILNQTKGRILAASLPYLLISLILEACAPN